MHIEDFKNEMKTHLKKCLTDEAIIGTLVHIDTSWNLWDPVKCIEDNKNVVLSAALDKYFDESFNEMHDTPNDWLPKIITKDVLLEYSKCMDWEWPVVRARHMCDSKLSFISNEIKELLEKMNIMHQLENKN